MEDPRFEIVDDALEPAVDGDVTQLLYRAYGEPGFTDPDQAESAFAASAVRRRGQLYLARDFGTRALLGIVICVPPNSPGRRLARDDELEMHLLAVTPDRRHEGIGRALVNQAIERARGLGVDGLVLWTQPTMHDAHRLYERAGFRRASQRDFAGGGRSYLVFELSLRQT